MQNCDRKVRASHLYRPAKPGTIVSAPSTSHVELGFRIPGCCFLPPEGLTIDTVGIEPRHGLCELALLERRDRAGDPEARRHFCCEPICKRALAFDVEARIELDHAVLGRDLAGEGRIGGGQQIDMNVIAYIRGRTVGTSPLNQVWIR